MKHEIVDAPKAKWIEAVQQGKTLLGFLDWQKSKETGISFLMVCRNGEDFLVENLNTLRGLTIPYEIVVVLDSSTDASEQIFMAFKNQGLAINIQACQHPVSAAGFQTLVTDAESVHSPVTLFNLGLAYCRMPWIMEWEEDFVCTKSFLSFLNSLSSIPGSKGSDKVAYSFCSQFEPGEAEDKDYRIRLSNSVSSYAKDGVRVKMELLDGTKIMKVIGATVLMKNVDREKDSRRESPWFLGTGGIEEERYRKLAPFFGKEPGEASSLGHFDDRFSWDKLSGSEKELEELDIHFKY